MMRAKLAVIIGSAAVVIGSAVGIVWWARSRGTSTAIRQPAPGAAVKLAAPPVTGSLRTENAAATGGPLPSKIPEKGEVPIEELKKIVVYPGGSRGLSGEAAATTLYDLTATPSAPAAVQEEAPVLVVPSSAAGTAGGQTAPTGVAGAADADNDGLTNDQELQLGTDPKKADTDGDGLLDGDEVRKYRTDPKVADTDGDGLSDGEEVNKWGTDPLNPDTDGDGYPDGKEVKGGYNPRGKGKV